MKEVEAELNPELLIEESADILKTLLEREQSMQSSRRSIAFAEIPERGEIMGDGQSQPEGDRESDGNEPQHHADLSAQRTKAFRKAYASLNYESAESVKLQVQKREIRRKDEEQKAEEQPEIPC